MHSRLKLLFLALVLSTLCLEGKHESLENNNTLAVKNMREEGISDGEFRQVISEFRNDSRLLRLWNNICVFPLEVEGNIVLARVDESGAKAEITCYWSEKPVNASKKGVVFDDFQSDIDGAWMGCGGNANFTKEIVEALHYKTSERLHLGEKLPYGYRNVSYILVSKCHYWSQEYCSRINSRFCRYEESEKIMSVAYAVIDGEGRIYW